VNKENYEKLFKELNLREESYNINIKFFKDKIDRVKLEIAALKATYIELNAAFIKNEQVIFKHNNEKYYIFERNLSYDLDIYYSLTDTDYSNMPPAKEVGAIYIANVPYAGIREDQLIKIK